jgi:hypothetical protein
MPDTTLILGGFAFQDFEVPETIPFPGSQAVSAFKMIGGGKVADGTGYYPGDIEWSGRFRGPNAFTRCQTLQALFKAGQAVALTWGALSFLVIPKTLTPNYERAYEIPYSVLLEVVSDQTTPFTSGAQSTLDDQVNGDLTTATNYGTTIGDPTLTSNLAAISSAISAVGSLDGASASQINSVLAPISTTIGYTQGLIATNNATITSAATFGGLVSGGQPLAMAASVTAQSSAMLALANQTALLSILTRTLTNLQADGASGATVVQAGGNLYDIASETYGDPSEWVTIAAANGLTDPSLTGVNSLRIPATTSGSGGVYPT